MNSVAVYNNECPSIEKEVIAECDDIQDTMHLARTLGLNPILNIDYIY